MAYDFDGAGDKITSAYTTHGSQRSYSIWTYRSGTGGGGFGRMFDKRTASGQVELLLIDNFGTDVYAYEVDRVTNNGEWSFAMPTANVWHNIVVTYDSSSTSNDPVIYVDGSSVTITEEGGAPNGAVSTNTDPYVVGNRGSDDARSWDGGLSDFAIWDRILSSTEAAKIGAGYSPLYFKTGLVFYAPLTGKFSPEKEVIGGTTLTITNAVAFAHHKITYPPKEIIGSGMVPNQTYNRW